MKTGTPVSESFGAKGLDSNLRGELIELRISAWFILFGKESELCVFYMQHLGISSKGAKLDWHVQDLEERFLYVYIIITYVGSLGFLLGIIAFLYLFVSIRNVHLVI